MRNGCKYREKTKNTKKRNQFIRVEKGDKFAVYFLRWKVSLWGYLQANESRLSWKQSPVTKELCPASRARCFPSRPGLAIKRHRAKRAGEDYDNWRYRTDREASGINRRRADSLPARLDSINSKTSNNNKLCFEPPATVCARFRLTFPQLASGLRDAITQAGRNKTKTSRTEPNQSKRQLEYNNYGVRVRLVGGGGGRADPGRRYAAYGVSSRHQALSYKMEEDASSQGLASSLLLSPDFLFPTSYKRVNVGNNSS